MIEDKMIVGFLRASFAIRHSPFIIVAAFFVLLTAVSSVPGATYIPTKVAPPAPSREFRAAWIATVGNIDWPSRKDLSVADQKAELIAMFDRAVQLKLNVIVFQVRPACDAMYDSKIEPWSEFLTGTMGKAPVPYYDPLAFAVEQAHKRGLELHAWFNPYRAGHPQAKSPVSANHISRTHPELVRHYGKQVWLDPGEKAVQDYSLSVVMDVVRRYDVDGVHFDDYFYPYKEQDASGNDMDFPDDISWRRFGVSRHISRDDWRRENVNAFIQRIYTSIKAAKPWVKFGVSPFGIWRPGNPPQIQGFDSYQKLYADSRKWLSKGWVDYFAPQLYWSIGSKEQSFPVLLKWWEQQNTKGRNLYAGMNTTHARSWGSDEILNQIRITRAERGVSGHIHWNMKSLMRNPSLDDALVAGVYTSPAIAPASPWLGSTQPARPALSQFERGSSTILTWTPTDSKNPWLWLVQTETGGVWKTDIIPGSQHSCTLSNTAPRIIALRAVDRNGILGAPVSLTRQSPPPQLAKKTAAKTNAAPTAIIAPAPVAAAPVVAPASPKPKAHKKLTAPKGD